MTPIIRKFVLKLLSKDRGSGITSIPGGQHRMIQESIITDTLLKKGVNPETITSEGMLQSILNGIKKEEAMIARSKAEAQKQLATVMDMKGRKIKPGSKIMGGEEVVETEAEIAERLGKGNKQAVENIKEKQLIESFDPDEMASGGRAGFAAGGMGRRAFLKLMAALGATGAAAKSGLVSLLGKGAGKEVAKEVAQHSTILSPLNKPPPYFFKLVDKIKTMGDDVTPSKDKTIAKKYKDYTMEEDFAGNIDIIKKGGDDMYPEDVYMSYQVDEVPLKGKKGSTKVEEYEEYTARPDQEGKMKDVEQGVPDEVIEEAGDTTAMTLKKADGGRVSRWMGGGLSKGKRTLSELLKMMAKDSSHGKTPSEMLKMINPKQFNKMLDRPEGIPSIAREMIEKYTKEMKGDRANMIEELIVTGRKIKKVDDDLVNYKIKIVEDMVSKGMDRATAKEMAETLAEMVAQGAGKRATPKITDEGLLEMENIQKNLATQDRKLNASGGIARMLGE